MIYHNFPLYAAITLYSYVYFIVPHCIKHVTIHPSLTTPNHWLVWCVENTGWNDASLIFLICRLLCPSPPPAQPPPPTTMSVVQMAVTAQPFQVVRAMGISHVCRSKWTYWLIPTRPHLDLFIESGFGRLRETALQLRLAPIDRWDGHRRSARKIPAFAIAGDSRFARTCAGPHIANSICLRPGSVLRFLSWASGRFGLITPKLRHLSWGTSHAHSQSICPNPPHSLLLLHYPTRLYFSVFPNLN